MPEYEINESDIMVLCKACDRYLELLRNDQNVKERMVEFYKEPQSTNEIMQEFDLKSSSFRCHYLGKMLASGDLQRIPDKPKNSKQKYY